MPRPSGLQKPDPDEQDPQTRMTNNLLGVIMALALLICGFWLAGKLAEDKRTQDCLTAGFRNCSVKQKPLR